jgi:hypothetical protein
MVMGILPILDIIFYPPYQTNARTSPPTWASRALVGHDALGCGNDCSAEALEDLGQLVRTGIDAQAGLGNAAQAG